MKCFLEADKGKGAGYEIISTHDTYEDAIKEVVPLTLRQGDDELYLIQGRLYERYAVTSCMMTEEQREYLNWLRSTGATWAGAGPYLQEEFPELTRTQARAVMVEWVETYDPKEDRYR